MTGTVHVAELTVADAARELARLNVGLVEATIAGSPLVADQEVRVARAAQALSAAQAAAEL